MENKKPCKNCKWEPREPDYIKITVGQGPFETQVGGNHYRDKYPFCQPAEFFARNKIEFVPANVCKYVLRHGSKGGIEDLRKAKHYLEMIAWTEYDEEL